MYNPHNKTGVNSKNYAINIRTEKNTLQEYCNKQKMYAYKR